MAEISVSIAGRTYRMACDEGEEARLGQLAARLDTKITELKQHFGAIGDQRIIVMAALTMVDALADAERRVAHLEADIEGLRGMKDLSQTRVDGVAEAVAATLAAVALRIERIAETLDGRSQD